MERPLASSNDWDQHDSHNCENDKVYSHIIKSAQGAFDGNQCTLSVAYSVSKGGRRVKLLMITLSKKGLPGLLGFTIRLLRTKHIPRTGEVTESHAFIFTVLPLQMCGRACKTYREKIEALITAAIGCDLQGSLQEDIFPLSQLPELLRRAVKLTAPAPAPVRPAPVPWVRPAPGHSDDRLLWRWVSRLGLDCRIDLLLR
jgi:hypothetical protein